MLGGVSDFRPAAGAAIVIATSCPLRICRLLFRNGMSHLNQFASLAKRLQQAQG